MNQNPLLKFWETLKHPSNSRTVGFLALLVLIAAVPLTVYVAQQRQEVRQRASTNCSGSLTYPGGNTCTTQYGNHNLNASWNITGGFGCNVFIRGDQGDERINADNGDCAGSKNITTYKGQQLTDDGHYQLFISNGDLGASSCSSNQSDPNQMVGDVIIPCLADLSVTNLSATPNPVKTSIQTTINSTGTGNSIKVYIHGSNPSATEDTSGGNYSSSNDVLAKKFYFVGSINPSSPTPLTITSPSKPGKYYLTAISLNNTADKVCSWDRVKYSLSGGQKQNIGTCSNKGPVAFDVTAGDKPRIGGRVTNSKDATKGIKDVEIQVYNNDAPAGVNKIQKIKTDADGKWFVDNFVNWGNTYSVWVTGNLANPKTSPPGFLPPAKTSTVGWTWDYCGKNSPGGVEEGDTVAGSTSYECQRPQQVNRKDCSGPDSSGKNETTLRCNFVYDPPPFPDAKIQFDNQDLNVRSKNISAGQTIGFKATLHANQGALSLGEIWVAKKDGSTPDFCPGQTNGKWCNIKAEIITDGTTTKPITGSWVSKVTTSPGEYWASVNAKDTLGGKCSGNPLDTLPAGWVRCDSADLDRLTIVVGAGPTGTSIAPTATATSTPLATTTSTQPPTTTQGQSPIPTATSTPIPGGTQLAFELILQGVGPNGGNQNPKKPTRQLKVQVFDTDNREVANKSGDITFDRGSGSFKGTVDLGVIQTNSNKFVIKVKTKRYLRKLIDGVTTLNLGALNKMPLTTMIVGDINDDNKLDINDYNILVGCFTNKANTSSCIDKENADLDDNSVIDGIDFNLFIRSLSIQEGD